MYLYATQVFNSHFRERVDAQIGHKRSQNGKSFHIFRYSPKPMPAMVTDIINEWVLVQLVCPQMYS